MLSHNIAENAGHLKVNILFETPYRIILSFIILLKYQNYFVSY